MRPPPQLVRVAARQVAVEDAGPASGFPVIVHHGGTRHLFPGAVRDAQAHGLRLISYDRPGQGMSVPQPGRVVADCAEDVRAILAHLGISRAATWGSSVGGPYALATAALLPGAITSVCVFASLAACGAPGLDFAEGMYIPHATAHFPADQDHTNVEENNRSAAIAWVHSHMIKSPSTA